MREIKFRAWNKEFKEMFYDPAIFDKKSDDLEDYCQYVGCCCININSAFKYSKHMVYMQYTGVKDKNENEIFEGDILSLEDMGITRTVEVKPPELFGCDAFTVFAYEFCSGYFTEDYDNPGLISFYEHNPLVIGNIYENPELLED